MLMGCEYFRFKYDCQKEEGISDMISDTSENMNKGHFDTLFETLKNQKKNAILVSVLGFMI